LIDFGGESYSAFAMSVHFVICVMLTCIITSEHKNIKKVNLIFKIVWMLTSAL